MSKSDCQFHVVPFLSSQTKSATDVTMIVADVPPINSDAVAVVANKTATDQTFVFWRRT
jgi:hypothetical protein